MPEELPTPKKSLKQLEKENQKTLSSSQIKLTGTGDGTSGLPYEIMKK